MTPATPKPRAGEHTSGPWRIEVHPDEKGVGLYADSWGFLGFLDSGAPDQANARRIVACVNFLEGIKSEDIESGCDLCADLKSERELLREALDQLATGMEQIAKAIPEAVAYMPGIKWMPERARALLAEHGR